MRKISITLFASFLLFNLLGLSYAQITRQENNEGDASNIEIIIGKIVSIDTNKNEITLADNLADWTRTVQVSPQIITSLEINRTVKVIIKSGTNTALSVRYFKKKKKKNH